MSGLFMPLIPVTRWKRQRPKANIKPKYRPTLGIDIRLLLLLRRLWRWLARTITKDGK